MKDQVFINAKSKENFSPKRNIIDNKTNTIIKTPLLSSLLARIIQNGIYQNFCLDMKY